jgi:hypothetical protein
MRRSTAVLALLLILSLVLMLSPEASADDSDEETTPVAAADSAAQIGDAFPDNCRFRVEVLIVGINDWNRIARALADDPSPCAEYWVSIPPGAIATNLRAPGIFAAIRNLGPRFHPVAEMRLGTDSGWAAWVERENKTWFEAGVEFRRRMVIAGLQPTLSETWLINEFDRTTRRDTNVRDDAEIRNGITRAYPRAAMQDLVRGLYYGDETMPDLPGAAEIGINFTHQNLPPPDVPAYKEEMKLWLEDSAFWSDMNLYVRWLLKEVYADTRYHSVPGSSRDERRRHLEDYQEHVIELAEAGPESIAPAREFLRRAYTPLLNGGFEALGGDEFEFTTGHGNTQVSPEQMMSFVAEQVYAVRHYTGAHPQGAPAGRIAFDWQTANRKPYTAAEFGAALDAIAARMASSIHYAYRQGGASPAGACAPPGSGEDWCQAEREGAVFIDAWEIFKRWD